MRIKISNVERVVSDEYGKDLVERGKAVEIPEKPAKKKGSSGGVKGAGLSD